MNRGRSYFGPGFWKGGPGPAPWGGGSFRKGNFASCRFFPWLPRQWWASSWWTSPVYDVEQDESDMLPVNEADFLKREARFIQKRLEQINARLKELEKQE